MKSNQQISHERDTPLVNVEVPLVGTRPRSNRALRGIANYGPAFVFLIVVLALWEVIVRGGLISATLLPQPTVIAQALVTHWGDLWVNTMQTLVETVIGLALSVLLGVVLAVLLDSSTWIRRTIYPVLITSQTIPMIALAPLLLIWFGYGLTPKVIVVILYCFFPIAVACADGLLGTDPDLLRLMKSMRATRWQILWMVRLPNAMPSFFSGLRIAATYSVTGAIFGEYVGAYQGLGIYMENAAHSFAIVLIFDAIVVTALLSLLLFGLVVWIERMALPWYQRSTLGESHARKTVGA
jgi:ABC-type nitrate/sulfonate/bicarbonate transport system permease component